MMVNQSIQSGIYLVIDPAMNQEILLAKLKLITKEKIAAIQIWDNFIADQENESLIRAIGLLASKATIPLLINNKWQLLTTIPLNGVHFDEIPENIDFIKKQINRPFIKGLTCNNDLKQIHWAANNQMDYISFCSMFPSTTSTSCELVNFETVLKAKEIFKKPIFLAGGIKPEHLAELNQLHCDGIAVVSGILNAENPTEAINSYQQQLKQKHENRNNQ